MGIVSHIRKIKEDTAGRVALIEVLIKHADILYKSYMKRGDSATLEEYKQVVAAINKFYLDGTETVQVGRLMYDELPVSMYATLKNHKYAYCRSAIKAMDKRLLKEGINVDELITFEEREKARFVTPQDVMGDD